MISLGSLSHLPICKRGILTKQFLSYFCPLQLYWAGLQQGLDCTELYSEAQGKGWALLGCTLRLNGWAGLYWASF